MTYIIVLNWNGWKDTIECLASILRLFDEHYRIVICDNHSSDDSIDQIGQWIDRQSDDALFLKDPIKTDHCGDGHRYQSIDYRAHPNTAPDKRHRISLIQTGENRGYGAGNNIGIRFALKDQAMTHIWILNNDVVVSPDSLGELHAYCQQHENLGVIGSKLRFYDEPNRIQAIGGKYNKWFATITHVGEFEFDAGQYDYDASVTKIDYPVGAALFVKKEFIEEVGLLSEEYFLYFEELDWVTRGRALGWQIGFCWQSIVFHKEGSSIGSNAKTRSKSRLADTYSLVNRITFTKKFYKPFIGTVRLGLLIAGLNRIRRGQFDRIGIVLKALTK